MERPGIVLPLPPRTLGGMFSRSQGLWFSLLSKIINKSKLLSPKIEWWILARRQKSPLKPKVKFGFYDEKVSSEKTTSQQNFRPHWTTAW